MKPKRNNSSCHNFIIYGRKAVQKKDNSFWTVPHLSPLGAPNENVNTVTDVEIMQ